MVQRHISHWFRAILLAVVIVSGLVTFIGVPLAAQVTEPRTQYESFDLSTPEAAVQTFVETFQKSDYAGLFLIFAPQTQQAWYANIAVRLSYDRVMQADAAELFMDEVEFGFDHTEVEHSPSLMDYYFDQVMVFAGKHDAFLIDLRGDVQILRREDTAVEPLRQAESFENEDETPLPAVNVFTTVEGIKDEVVFRMVPSPSGRWRVLQVIVEGGNEELTPWSVVEVDE